MSLYDYYTPLCHLITCTPKYCTKPTCVRDCTDCFAGTAHIVAGMCVLVAENEEGFFNAIKPPDFLKNLDFVCEKHTTLTNVSKNTLKRLTH